MLLHRQQSALPTLNLALAVDGAFPPTVTFTRASTATFVGSNGLIQTASSGQARFGYDPVTLSPLGYLSEEQRTNLTVQSGTPSNAGWTVVAAPKTSTNNAAPDGTSTAALITSDGTSTGHQVRSPDTSYTLNTVYAVSKFVKAGTSTLAQLIVGGGISAANVYANFSLSGSGSVTASGAGVSSPTIVAYGSGWYRVSFVFTAGLTAPDAGPSIAFITGGTDTRLPTNSSAGTLQVWGAQVEATTANYPGPTSYIPTAGSTVTRAADVASMTGANFSSWYNQSAGTFVVQMTPPGDYDQYGTVFYASDGSGSNVNYLTKVNSAGNAAGKRWQGVTFVGGAAQAFPTTPSDGAAVPTKIAYGYQLNDFAMAKDGSLIATDTSGTVPSTVNRLDIGQNNGSATWFNGHIASIKFYPIRPPNTTLQALTS